LVLMSTFTSHRTNLTMASPTVDLTHLQSQLASLERQKSLLISQLLSLRSAHPLSTKPPSKPAVDASIDSNAATDIADSESPPPSAADPLTDSDILFQVFASSSAQQKAALTRLHRMTGITTFTVRDPSPPHDMLLGVRFDVFSQRISPANSLPSAIHC
jgi:hypothetical protein